MWATEVVPRLEGIGLGRAGRGADVPPGGDRRVAGRRAARRDDAAGDQPARRDLCPGRGGGRPDLGGEPTAIDRPATWSRRRRGAVLGHARHATSGRPATRAGATPSARGSASWAGRCRSWRSGPAATLGTLLGDLPLSASRVDRARRAGGRGPWPSAGHASEPDGPTMTSRPTTWSATRVEPASWAASEVGLAVRTRPRTGDMVVSIAVATPAGERHGAAGPSS